MKRWGWFLAVPLAAGASAAAPPRAAVMPSVYLYYIAPPTLRATRRTSCGEIRSQSIPVDRRTEEITEKSQWAGMRLLTKQMDCRFPGAFYAELRYAAVRHGLGEGAWRSCVRLAPMGHLATAVALRIYLQCLRMIEGAKACQTARNEPRPCSVSGNATACANVLRRNDWAQWGELKWSDTPLSLFHGQQPQTSAPSPRGTRVLHLPTRVTLRGRIRTGFFLNCCLFGMGSDKGSDRAENAAVDRQCIAASGGTGARLLLPCTQVALASPADHRIPARDRSVHGQHDHWVWGLPECQIFRMEVGTHFALAR